MDTQPTNADIVNQTQNGNEAKVTMAQSDLETLINSKYAKGAEKATKQLLETLGVDSVDSIKNALARQKEIEESSKSETQKLLDAMKQKEEEINSLKGIIEASKIESLALKSGVKDLDYFKYEFDKNSKVEGFDSDKFIEDLRVNKSFLFEEKKVVVKTDSTTNNNNQLSFQDRVKQAKTKQELDALYKEFGINY